jgi:hypothetical protein
MQSMPDPATSLDSNPYRLRFPNLSVKNSMESRNHIISGRNLVVDSKAIALMKLDLMGPMVDANYHGFATRFESRGAHRCEE